MCLILRGGSDDYDPRSRSVPNNEDNHAAAAECRARVEADLAGHPPTGSLDCLGGSIPAAEHLRICSTLLLLNDRKRRVLFTPDARILSDR